MSGGHTLADLRDGWILSQYWKVVIRVGIVEVRVRDSGVGVSNGCFDSAVDEHRVIVGRLVVEVIQV